MFGLGQRGGACACKKKVAKLQKSPHFEHFESIIADSLVQSQGSSLGEPFPADVALVGLLPRVGDHVPLEPERVGGGVVAAAAPERLLAAVAQQDVPLQLGRLHPAKVKTSLRGIGGRTSRGQTGPPPHS